MSSINEIKKKLLDIETEAYGTAKIFERRKNVLLLPRQILLFLGIAVPLFLGATALSFGMDAKILPTLLTILGVISVLQIVTALWSVIRQWDDKYISYNDSQKENTEIYNEAKRIKDSVNNENKIESEGKLRDLKIKSETREKLDLDTNVSEKEKRYATRARNLYYRAKCHICNEIPTSMKPGKCDGCGNYRLFKSK